MELLSYWLLRASVLITLFYCFYRFFIAGSTLHSLNRVLLLSMVLFSALLPLFRFELMPQRKEAMLGGGVAGNIVNAPTAEVVQSLPWENIPWMEVCLVLFAVGFIFTLVRYLMGLVRVVSIIRKSSRRVLENGTVLCVVDKDISPFSWMKYIVVSHKELLGDSRAVIRHETAHIKLYHSWDLLLFDLFSCIFWFLPFSWLLRSEMQAVHEYQADREVLRSGVNIKQYQLLLIRKSVGECKFALANNFRQRHLHKRITMMMKNKTNKRVKWAYAMLCPVLLLALMVLSVPNLNAKQRDSLKVVGKVIGVELMDTLQPGGTIISYSASKSALEVADSLQSSSLELKVHTSIDNQPLYILDGTPILHKEMEKIDPNNIEAISILKDETATAIYGSKGLNGVVLITTKNGEMKTSTSKMETTDSLRGRVRKVTTTRDLKGGKLGVKSDNKPFIIVDGEKKTKDFNLDAIDPNTIKSVTVLKDKNATDIYGKEGENGVVLIELKEKE